MVLCWPWWPARGSTTDLGRRIARAQAAAPPGRLADKGAAPAPGCWSVGREHENTQVLTSPRRCVLGRLPAWCLTMGLDRDVVTTLRGRWAGDGPVSSVPQGPSGSAGEQTAAAARPRHVRSAVGQALTGP